MASTLQKRVACYIRVSTQEQSQEGYSIQAQTEKLKAYCDLKDGWTCYKVYTDPGFTGSNINRPAMRELIRDAKEKQFDIVLVYKLDRLSRSQKDTLYLIEDVFNPVDIGFISLQENFDTTTSFGKAIIGMLSVFAQLEREQIKERTSMGRKERAKNGLWHGGCNRPFGYDYIDGKLVINEYEAEQIRLLFKMYADNIAVHTIAVFMKEHGFTSKKWDNPGNVQKLLKNPLYMGNLEYKGEICKGQHQAIIDESTFAAVQKVLEHRSWTKKDLPGSARPFQAIYLLSGILYCGNCKARYFATKQYSRKTDENGKRIETHYYKCYSRAYRTRKTGAYMVTSQDCKNKSWDMKKLDAEIIKAIYDLVKYDKNIEEMQRAKTPQVITTNNRETLQAKISFMDDKIKGIIKLYTSGHLNISDTESQLSALNKEREQFVKALDNLKDKPAALSIKETREILKSANAALTGDDLEKKKQIVHSLIKRIDLHDNGDITINWAFVPD